MAFFVLRRSNAAFFRWLKGRYNLPLLLVIILTALWIAVYLKEAQRDDEPESRDEAMSLRMNRVREVCLKYGRNRTLWPAARDQSMMLDKEHRIGACLHGNAAAKTVIRYLESLKPGSNDSLFLVGPALHIERMTQAKAAARGEAARLSGVDEVATYLMKHKMVPFTFVRHPFERVASSYDGLKIQGSFPDFVDELLAAQRKAGGGSDFCSWTEDKCKTINRYLKPYFVRCAFCNIPYLIGKVDTFSEDLEYIYRRAGLHFPSCNASKELRESIVAHREFEQGKTSLYFRSLNSKQKEGLRRAYKLDLDLFGFRAEKYI